MSRPFPGPVRLCPSCGAALNSGAITCNSCGGLVAVESILGRLKTEMRYRSGQAGEQLRSRQTLLWTLALCPIVILPPVLAIFLSFRAPETTDVAAAGSRSPDPLVLIVAICNIVLSVVFWRWIGDSALSMGLSIGLFLKSIGITHPSGLRSI